MMDIHLRSCTKDDWNVILNLRNQFYSGSFFTQDKPLTKAEHYQYMNKQSTNSDFHQWIAMKNDVIVGYIRILDLEINILVVKEYQNKGIGTQMLQLLEVEAKKLKIEKIRGTVREDNIASKQLFEKNNYVLKSYLFEKSLK